jgi:tripartite-type tricarboxylate transporter receptor subunit TctC
MMICGRRFFSTCFVIAVACGLLSTATALHAQTWPNRPIKLIVPYAAGGPADAMARQIATKMQSSLGQPVVVDNRGGAGGTIGVEATLKSASDGYTIALVATGPLAGMPNLTKTSYSLDDIQYLTLAAKIPSVVVANSKSGLDSMSALLAKAKAQPGKLNYSSAGPGTTPHIGMEILKSQAKISLLHIPYRGAAPAITALLGGEVELAMVDLLPVLPHIKSGAFKALAIAGTSRSPLLPNVPTTAESGLPGVTMETTYGLIAPKGLPPTIVTQVRDAAIAAVNSAEVKQWLQQQGAIPVTSTAAEYQQAMKAESDKWKGIIIKANITLN